MPNIRIVYEKQFASQLRSIIAFITRDNPAARSFRNNLKHCIEQLPDNQLACRQSSYFTDSNLRDLIFMGYIAIFRIAVDEIRLLDIVKWQEITGQRNGEASDILSWRVANGIVTS